MSKELIPQYARVEPPLAHCPICGQAIRDLEHGGERTPCLHQPSAISHLPLSDSWWFFQQAAACADEVPPEGTLDANLRWGVPASHRTQTPAGLEPTHDDRLLSAALIAEMDRLFREGNLALGLARSHVIPAPDPLGQGVY